MPDRRSAFDEGPRTQDDRDTAEGIGVAGCGVHPGEERDSCRASLRRAEAQLRRATLLGARLLRVDRRSGRGGDPR